MKSTLRPLLAIFTFLIGITCFSQQKVGIVLSGGGATGLAHIGVLKALEERGIPIDFITGTSAGAIVGSLYACGYSPAELEQIVISEQFQRMSYGQLEKYQHFAYRELDPTASMFNVSLSSDSLLKKSLPTNIRSSTYLDYTMMRLIGATGEAKHNNFDSLFVPFRCVAADIANKKGVVFKEGHLNECVRASMTYPLMYTPLKIDGVLYFDGGMYNNFPADIMYEEFNPDYMIGSTVTGNSKKPKEDDLMSQLRNMLVSYSNYSLPCDQGIMIKPETDVATFDFASAKKAIDDGYNGTLAYLDSIEMHVTRKVDPLDLAARRKAFRESVPALRVSSVTTMNRKSKELIFAKKSMLKVKRKDKKKEVLTEYKLEKRYFRLNATPQVDFIFPTLDLKEDSTYNLNLAIDKSKDLSIEIGGHVSSRPINTGYVGLYYKMLGRVASTIHVNSYFGKFYGSAKASYTVEIPSTYPVSLSTYFIMNRWDYFRSFATFFEDVKPSYLIQNEMFVGLEFKHPLGNSIKSTFEGKYFLNEDDYYQSDNFTNLDTTDFTKFQGTTVSWEFEQNTLNRKQFANSGHYAAVKFRYVYGSEHSVSGSTAPISFDETKIHNWINLSADFRTFIIDKPSFHLGLQGNAVLNSQSLFANYTSSILATTAYAPVPDLLTFFIPKYRSPQYVGLGTNFIFTVKKNFDIRLEGYYYQPFVSIARNDDGTFGYTKPFKGDAFIASGSLIFNSFIGPIRATVNYFPVQKSQFSFQFSVGYTLFNKRSIR